MQPPSFPPVVEGCLVNTQLLGNLGHALPMGRAHPFSHISLNSRIDALICSIKPPSDLNKKASSFLALGGLEKDQSAPVAADGC